MTGSALTRWTLHDRAGGSNRGGSLREGSGCQILRGRRPGGFFLLAFFHGFSRLVLVFFLVFFGFSWLFLTFPAFS